MTERGRVRVETGQKRVRAIRDGVTVVDTTAPRLVWESPYYPTYYFPVDDVRMDLFVESGTTSRSPSRGDATHYSLAAAPGEPRAAYRHEESPIEALRGLIAIEWSAMDHWFEEDEEVFVHPRDPYKRIDALPSSRRVEVRIDGVTVADSQRAVFLFETGLPVRYYLPKTDVRMDLLTPTDHRTECPYKGTAHYWTASVDGSDLENVVWSYPFPVHESARIAGMMAFYDERVDVVVDGVLQERPSTPFV